MNKLIVAIAALFFSTLVAALPPAPAKPQQGPIAVTGATIHVGNGEVIENGVVTFADGVITGVYQNSESADLTNHTVIDKSGEHLYPGFILPNTRLGLREVGSVRASVDDRERGLTNASVRSLTSYNTDSELIPTYRFNGVLTAQVTPIGSLIAGNSSVMQLDAWNWQDAAILEDDAMHVYWPKLIKKKTDALKQQVNYEENDKYEVHIEVLRELFAEATSGTETNNLNINAVQAVLRGERQLFLHAENARQIVDAIQFVDQFDVPRAVLVGARDAELVKDIVLASKLPVIVQFVHGLPVHPERSVDESYDRAARFVEAGFKVGLPANVRMEPSSGRNLPFMAGTVAAYGIGAEQAVKMITLNNAEILGIDKQLCSIEVGKQATLFTSSGDALDMRTNNLTSAFIQGRQVEIRGMQQELFERFREKYSD